MTLKTQLPTNEMQVTSIRFERALIDQLKALAGSQGYQALVREVLWDYVRQHSDDPAVRICKQQIRATWMSQAQRQERCALTGEVIAPQAAMLLALTTDEQLVPLSLNSLESELH